MWTYERSENQKALQFLGTLFFATSHFLNSRNESVNKTKNKPGIFRAFVFYFRSVDAGSFSNGGGDYFNYL